MAVHRERCIDSVHCDLCGGCVHRRNLKGHRGRCAKTKGMKIRKKRRTYSLRDKFRILQEWRKLKSRRGDLNAFLEKKELRLRQLDAFKAVCFKACDKFEYLPWQELKRTIKNKDLRAISPRSGRPQYVFTDAMTEDLKSFIAANRGPASEELLPNLDTSEDGYRTLTYHHWNSDLAPQLQHWK